MSQEGLEATRTLAERYSAVVNSLTPEELALASRCSGWSVQDLVAHASSNFKAMVEPPAGDAAAADGPAPLAEELMSAMVDARRDWTSTQVLDELNTYQPGWLAALEALQQEPSASVEVAMSELGTYPLHAMADAYAFDIACHLYVDMLAPTGPIARDVDPLDHATLSPGIGWMLTGLPQMCPTVSGVLDRPLGLVLTGPGGGEWTLRPGSPLLTVEPGLADDVAAQVESDAFAFMLWGTARTPWRESATLSGDEAYATKVLDEINIV